MVKKDEPLTFKRLEEEHPILFALYVKERALQSSEGPLSTKDIAAGPSSGGMDWAFSNQGHDFWSSHLQPSDAYRKEYSKRYKNKGKFSIIT